MNRDKAEVNAANKIVDVLCDFIDFDEEIGEAIREYARVSHPADNRPMAEAIMGGLAKTTLVIAIEQEQQSFLDLFNLS